MSRTQPWQGQPVRQADPMPNQLIIQLSEFFASQARSETLQAKRVAKLGKKTEQTRAKMGVKVGDTHSVLDDSFRADPSVQALGMVLFYFLERSEFTPPFNSRN